MTITARILIGCLILSAAGGILADESRTLTGEWVWNQRGERGSLEAVFTPTGEDTWDVRFHFTFRDKPRTYAGTAQGSLAEGQLTGRVLNETKQRTFTFVGAFEGGRFEGTHAEIEGSRSVDTGTLTLQN